MSVLAINRKRKSPIVYYQNLDLGFPNCSRSHPDFDRRLYSHVCKKFKLSSMNSSPHWLVSSKSVASRMSLYPQPINRFCRQVHAPCRVPRFGFVASSRLGTSGFKRKECLADLMGNILGFTIQQFKKEREVIDVETENGEDGVSEDSSIDREIEFVEDRCEGRSEISKGTNGVLDKFSELDRKVVEQDFQSLSSSVSLDLKVDSLSINSELDVLGEPLHRQLLESAERRNPKLSSLGFQIEFNEKLRSKLHLLRLVKKPEEVVLRELFVPLAEEDEVEVSRALSSSNRRKVLVSHMNSNIEITGRTLQCLRPRAWLNDEVINLYLELLKEREKREPNKFLKCHFFNTFFYKKLRGRSGYDFKSVRRWTTQRKLGYFLLDCDKIFVPIHKEVHWCLAVINKKEEKFQYLDSLRGIDSHVLKVLSRYFVDEVKDKSGKELDVSSWKKEYVEDLPEQENGWDCGMFMIKYTDFYSRGVGLCFKQEHMPYFRRRTAKEILKLKAE